MKAGGESGGSWRYMKMDPPSDFLYKMGGVVRKIKWISAWF